MKVEQLIDQFELVTDTEEGLEQLRNVILNQAVRGNLTKQDQNDEPAKKHLERIEAEKNRLYEEGKIRKPKDLPPVTSEEIPYEVSENWLWTRLGEIGDWGAGATPTRSNSEYFGGDLPWLKTGELNDGYISSSEETVTQKGFENSSLRLCKPGDVLIAMYGATIGKLGILEIEATTNQACCACTPYADFSNLFLFYYLLALRENFRLQGAGGAQPNISKTKIEHTLLSLPPVEEQQRIVQKIETLFAQVDELEQKVQQDREVDERLQVAVLDDLQSAETPEASKQSWQRLTDHFEQIYRKPEHIDQLKQAILNEAVRGRLVPQDSNDEPAEKLLERIKEEKQRLYDEGEIRKPKDLPEIADEEIPYDIPDNWKWDRFGNIAYDFMTGVERPKKDQDPSYPYPYVKMNNITATGQIDLSDLVYVQATSDEVEKYKLRNGDFLFNTRNSEELVGKTCVFHGGEESPYLFNNNILRVDFGNSLSPDYINSWFNSYICNVLLDSITSATTNVAAIYQKDLLKLSVPIPPKEEQVRIINRVEELFTWCDDLKEKLCRSQQTDQRLLEALVNGALEDNEESKEPEEATIYQMSKREDFDIQELPDISTTDVHAGIIAKVIKVHKENPKYKGRLGHVKAEKICHLVESHLGVELDRRPQRLAAGPADFTHLKKVEHRARMAGWFTIVDKRIGYSYKSGRNIDQIIDKVDDRLGSKRTKVDKLIDLFLPMDKTQSEIVATLYAAWNDLLAMSKKPSDDDIVNEASTAERWAPQKEKIDKQKFYKALNWMRDKGLIPTGRGKVTAQN